jgi:hypothetical protein
MVVKRSEDELALKLVNGVTDEAANDCGQLRKVCSPRRRYALGRVDG